MIFTSSPENIYGTIFDKKIIIVANKIDLDDSSEKRVQEAFPQHETVPLSALEGENIQELYDKMAEKFV